MSNAADNIKDLQKQIEKQKAVMNNCKHEYGLPYYDPTTEKVPDGFKTVGHGSDVWTEVTGYHDKEIPRWTKKCSHCGHEVYAYKQKPVINNYEPDFGS